MNQYSRLLGIHNIPPGTQGSIDALSTFGGATLVLQSPPMSMWSWRASPDADRAVFVFLLRGRVAVDGGGSSSSIRSGGALLMHSARDVGLTWSDDASILALGLPLDAVTGSGVDVDALPVDFERTALLAATRAFALALTREPAPATRFSDYIAERLLAEMGFGLVLEGREVSRGVQRGSLADRARTIMLVRRSEPDLTASSIAADLHVSSRQLQREFARAGTSPASVLRQLRVDLAVSMLRDRDFDGLTVDQVARYSGFRSAPVMRHSFDHEGMATPREIRRTRIRGAS